MRKPLKLINRNAYLRKTYFLRLEIAMITSLLLITGGFKIQFKYGTDTKKLYTNHTEDIFIEEIIQTKQELIAPTPPKPVIPVEVPNDEIIEDELIDLDSELDLNDATISIPLPPKLPRDVEDMEEEIFIVVEQAPELIGGLAGLQKLISYPEIAAMAGIEGRVILQFVVNKEGNVIDPVVIRGIGGGCDEEALRAIKQVKFKPGKQRGIPVNVKYSLPISFRLKNN